MKILFLGDIVGVSGCNAVKKYLPKIIQEKNIDFVVVNGENALWFSRDPREVFTNCFRRQNGT